jgi:hypothetical protein
MFARGEERTSNTAVLRAGEPSVTVVFMSDEELEQQMENFANEDAYYDKTFTRIVVEKFLGKVRIRESIPGIDRSLGRFNTSPFSLHLLQFSWYFPMKDLQNAPSLTKAYAYYEHITLPRHFVGDQTASHVLRRAEPGETQPTELYSPFKTPNSSFNEWGIGIDLYFSTLLIMALVLLLAGLIHLPNLIFYRSSDYSSTAKEDLSWSLKGSAVCNTTEWVVCKDCKESEWHAFEEKDRIAFAPNGPVLVLQNLCNGGELPQGLVNLSVLFFLVVVLCLLAAYLGAREVRFDEDKLTSTDYSVIVKNPPKDAYNPDEWRDFFAQFAEKQ